MKVTKSSTLQSGSRLQLTPEASHQEEKMDGMTAVKLIDPHMKYNEKEAKRSLFKAFVDQIIGWDGHTFTDIIFMLEIIDIRCNNMNTFFWLAFWGIMCLKITLSEFLFSNFTVVNEYCCTCVCVCKCVTHYVSAQ